MEEGLDMTNPVFVSREKPKVTKKVWCLNLTKLQPFHNINQVFERVFGRKVLCIAGMGMCWTAGAVSLSI